MFLNNRSIGSEHQLVCAVIYINMSLACESLNFCAEDDGNAVQIFVFVFLAPNFLRNLKLAEFMKQNFLSMLTQNSYSPFCVCAKINIFDASNG